GTTPEARPRAGRRLPGAAVRTPGPPQRQVFWPRLSLRGDGVRKLGRLPGQLDGSGLRLSGHVKTRAVVADFRGMHADRPWSAADQKDHDSLAGAVVFVPAGEVADDLGGLQLPSVDFHRLARPIPDALGDVVEPTCALGEFVGRPPAVGL